MPDLGVITNISYAHIRNFKNLYEIALAKSEMINNIVSGGSIVLNKDDKFFNFLKNKALKKKLKVISFSEKNNADIRMIKITRKKSNYLLILKISNNIKKFIIKESLKFYIVNILATIAVISNYTDVQSLKENFFYSFKIPKGRGDFSKIKLNNKSINIVDESYNSNPLSLEFAINNFNKMNVSSKSKKILLGDMLELGKFSKNLHREAAKIVNKSKINKVFVYGKDIKETFNKIKTQKKGRILNSKKEIISLMKNDLRDNDYLMVKASNATGLNNVISQIKLGQLNVI
jgi:murE/murF fusion protein